MALLPHAEVRPLEELLPERQKPAVGLVAAHPPLPVPTRCFNEQVAARPVLPAKPEEVLVRAP